MSALLHRAAPMARVATGVAGCRRGRTAGGRILGSATSGATRRRDNGTVVDAPSIKWPRGLSIRYRSHFAHRILVTSGRLLAGPSADARTLHAPAADHLTPWGERPSLSPGK